MFNKSKYSLNIQLILIGFSLILISTFLGLIAYLTDKSEQIDLPVQMRYGTDFGISIALEDSKAYETITPGGEIDFKPYVKNEGDYDVFVFIEVELPDVQNYHLKGLNNEWCELSSVSSNENKQIYAYGSESTLTTLEHKNRKGKQDYTPSPLLCTGIFLDEDTDLAEGLHTVSVTGYAVQADGMDGIAPTKGSNPLTIWSEIQDEIAKTSTTNNSTP